MENNLKNETSPYLLQHKNNPVNWYPWGDEAFRKARAENKPVFLSIGYSTCHWCHVMARESFEDNETADLLNKYFISVKVDREERPDKYTNHDVKRATIRSFMRKRAFNTERSEDVLRYFPYYVTQL